MANITIDYSNLVYPLKRQNISKYYSLFQSWGVETVSITFNELSDIKCIGGYSLPDGILSEALEINGNVVKITLTRMQGADTNVLLDITAIGV